MENEKKVCGLEERTAIYVIDFFDSCYLNFWIFLWFLLFTFGI